MNQVEENIEGLSSKITEESRLFKKIEELDFHASTIGYSLCSMANRQDERMEMAFGVTQIDTYQKQLLKKLYI